MTPKKTYHPNEVIPENVAAALRSIGNWFVIGGQAVRCLLPYRPSRDVDLAVRQAKDLQSLLKGLEAAGKVEFIERSDNTVHLLLDKVKVSIFVLDELADFSSDGRLNRDGILATKLHAILDRGTRRDFFDLYVVLQLEGLGIIEALSAMRRVYRQELNEPLLLRALTFFDDADREAALQGEGPRDWESVKDYFYRRVGDLLVPPSIRLKIQAQVVDVHPQRES